jgi:hypothetical protein
MAFDDEINRILNETYFGGSPHEQATGIKRHVTFEETDEEKAFKDAQAASDREDQDDPSRGDDTEVGEYAKVLEDQLGEIDPYYAFAGDDHITNRKSQVQQDEVIDDLLGHETLVKKNFIPDFKATGNDLHIYVIEDGDTVSELKPYVLVASSWEDLGERVSLDPVSQFKSVLIGKSTDEDENGVPILTKDKWIYDGPSKAGTKDWSGKEPENKGPVTGDTKIDYDANRQAVQKAIAQGLMRK